MTSQLRRLFLVPLVFALIASACSSSEGETAADTVADADEAAQPDQAADATEADDTGSGTTSDANEPDPALTDADDATDAATSIPVPEDDSAGDDAIAGLGEPEVTDPPTVARDFVRNRFNIDPDADAIACIVDQSSSDDVLAAALQSGQVASGDVVDAELKALSFAVNGCVDSTSLGDWTTQAIGPQGEVADTAPACFADRFDDPDRGDVAFYTIVALTFQFRVEPDGVPDALDAFVTCTPVTALADFFANQSEAESNFATVIDRECLVQEVSDPAVSELFWSTLIEGLETPVSAMAPFLEACESAPNAEFADAVPTDFVAWAGTGALASVTPAARANVYSSPPPMTIDASASYEAIFATADAQVRVQLFADTAPIAVNNFVNLARDGYFDGTVFHRVLDDFMAQGGDPTGTGTGGPGYQFEDEFDNDRAFDRPGLLALANSGPATNGSQFFITFVPTDWLTGAHTIFGEVTEGFELIQAIERRDPGAPNGRGQVLESVTIIES